MVYEWDALGREEQTILQLRRLFEQYGYKKFRMNKFEEYAFYSKYKNFLKSEQFITFSDTDGKLMALKPDITLSIIKNAKAENEGIQRLYYNESVYRVSRHGGEFKEIGQTGVELIGKVTACERAEVIALAAKSLGIIGDSYMLELSHMGYISGALEDLLPAHADRQEVFACMQNKNTHDLSVVAQKAGLNAENTAFLCSLTDMGGRLCDVLPRARALAKNAKMLAAINELEQLSTALAGCGFAQRLRLDFSVLSNTDYYNGLLFRGYVENVPGAVVVGGQYDNLLQRMGKPQLQAIGFAINFDELGRYFKTQRTDILDALLLYTADADPAQVTAVAESYVQKGQKICMETVLPQGLQYKTLVLVSGTGVKEEQGNA